MNKPYYILYIDQISKNKDFWSKAWLTKRIKKPQIAFRNLY